MPDLLTLKQLAEYLQLSERSVYRLLERGELPAAKVGGQWRFRKSAVDAWLNLRDDVILPAPRVGDVLAADNIILDLPAGSKAEVLGALVERLRIPEPVDRALLLERLLEREGLCSTAMADGVALPHTPRTQPRILRAHHLVAVARTVTPIDFGALDRSLTSVLVLVLAGDERTHLTLTAKMAQLVREPEVSRALRSGDAGAIRDTLARTERRIFGD